MQDLNINDLAFQLSGGRSEREMQEMFSYEKRVNQTLELTEHQINKTIQFYETVSTEKKAIDTSFKSLPYDATKEVFKTYLQKINFKSTSKNKNVLEDLCSWLSGCSVQDEKGNIILDAKKGLFLCGGTGNGKTTLIKLLQKIAIQNDNYRFRHFKIKNTSELLADMANGHVPMPNDFNYNWCFDDVGVNYYEVSRIYGNSFHPIPYLIDLMYNHFKAGKFVIMTSNLSIKEILYKNPQDAKENWIFKDGFDSRTRGRLNEMFNVIINNDVDYRFKN